MLSFFSSNNNNNSHTELRNLHCYEMFFLLPLKIYQIQINHLVTFHLFWPCKNHTNNHHQMRSLLDYKTNTRILSNVNVKILWTRRTHSRHEWVGEWRENVIYMLYFVNSSKPIEVALSWYSFPAAGPMPLVFSVFKAWSKRIKHRADNCIRRLWHESKGNFIYKLSHYQTNGSDERARAHTHTPPESAYNHIQHEFRMVFGTVCYN